ncbi:Beta-D-glucosyl crocetin beta-1,6-glucosyltransferase [Camellia lanceoleosa]|uniref:Beta-D-glucosyl crocetin beta-1,6-glucosyltransferase n=1 Tax=Camellia lanceoleosa TaxID=1840588 RepID=A0ACC0IZU1_9ERIC|nr:Beta-D-glucosyl crocetin beta-1,6-glucosyltransferase [Camellia lanceoleosa]
MDTKQSIASVLMLPWLAHGHISPFLELAKKLSHRNLYIYLCSTPINLNSIKKRITEKYSHSIELVEIHLPSLPELPPHNHTTNGLPNHLIPTLKTAFEMAIPSFTNILKTLSPDLLIYDFNQPWAPTIASSYNIPAVDFIPTGAAMPSFTVHLRMKGGVEFPFPAIQIQGFHKMQFGKMIKTAANRAKNKEGPLDAMKRSFNIILFHTFRELEGQYVDYLAALVEKKIVPVGSLVREIDDEDNHAEIIEWLDNKDESSTVFVSFGNSYFFLKELKNSGERNRIMKFNQGRIFIHVDIPALKDSNSIKKRITENYSHSIELVEIHLPSSLDLPPHYHTTNGLPTHLIPTLKTAFDMAIPSFSNILNTLTPNLVIYDFNLPWAPTIACSYGIPAVDFIPTGAAMTSSTLHMFTKRGGAEFPFPEIQLRGFHETRFRNLIKKASANKDKNKEEGVVDAMKRSHKIILFHTFRELEGKYIDYLSVLIEKKIVPVGSLVREIDDEGEHSEIIQWLDNKGGSSTVFVSFGSGSDPELN